MDKSGNRGRPRTDRRAALSGIVYVLVNNIPWRLLPTQFYRVSGNTCWRLFRGWVADGRWLMVEHAVVHEWIARGESDLAISLMQRAHTRMGKTRRRAPPKRDEQSRCG
ncbi:transposase [Burkholderia pyrrocinia]|nr:transposase [Burkholderia pyrrocinia]